MLKRNAFTRTAGIPVGDKGERADFSKRGQRVQESRSHQLRIRTGSMPTSQALALRAGCHESGSSSSMEARRSNTDRAMFPLYGTRSSIGAIPAFYPMVLTGVSHQRHVPFEYGRCGHPLPSGKAVSMKLTPAMQARVSPLAVESVEGQSG